LREVGAGSWWGLVGPPPRSVCGAMGVGEAPSLKRRVGCVHWRDLWGAGGGRGSFGPEPPLPPASRRLVMSPRDPSRHHQPQNDPRPPPAPHMRQIGTQPTRRFREGASPTPVAPPTDRGGVTRSHQHTASTSLKNPPTDASHPYRPRDIYYGRRDEPPAGATNHQRARRVTSGRDTSVFPRNEACEDATSENPNATPSQGIKKGVLGGATPLEGVKEGAYGCSGAPNLSRHQRLTSGADQTTGAGGSDLRK
jgi:hypothetical protein